MVLVCDKDDRNPPEPCSNHPAIHGVADNTVNTQCEDQAPDAQCGFKQIKCDPFRARERLFQGEKSVLPFKADFPLPAVQVGTPVFMDKIVGLPVGDEVNLMTVLLQVMPEVNAAGRMPEPFPAYHKQDPHRVFTEK